LTQQKSENLTDLIARTWQLIDYINGRLSDSALSENEKIRWAGVLANTIGTLNKLFYKAGVGKLGEDDLVMLMSKIPKKFRRLIRRKMLLAKSKTPIRDMSRKN